MDDNSGWMLLFIALGLAIAVAELFSGDGSTSYVLGSIAAIYQ